MCMLNFKADDTWGNYLRLGWATLVNVGINGQLGEAWGLQLI